MRNIGGLPLIYWLGALGLGVGAFVWIKKKGGAGATSPATAGKGAAANSFTQAQEVQDFQVFSALTGAQQASDLNFLSEVAGLFSGGSSTGTSSGSGAAAGGGGSSTPTPAPVTPAPPSTGSAPPATAPVSSSSGSPGVTYLEPGGPVTFAAPPPPGFGYGFQNGQWGLTAGSGVGYVAA